MTEILSTVDTTVLLVTTMQRNRKSDGKAFSIWEVTTQDGTKWQTFDAAVGNTALALQGQQAHLQVKVKQSGDFTNYYLDRISPIAGGAVSPVQNPVVEAAQQAQQAQTVAPVVSYDQYKDLTEGRDKAKALGINRAVAVKTASQLNSTNGEEFWWNVDEILTYLETGLHPGSVTSHSDPPPHTDADAPALSDESIPF